MFGTVRKIRKNKKRMCLTGGKQLMEDKSSSCQALQEMCSTTPQTKTDKKDTTTTKT